MGALAPAYRPRRPTETVLHAVVREWLETFLAHARDTYDAPIPRYVEQELRGYLRCGVFAHGFVRARCDGCGHDLLVAFSCKARAVCPSCAGRRMANVAAHLVDRVLPAVPLRQWVLSLPFELRRLAAFRADVLSAAPAPCGDELEAIVRRVHARAASWLRRHGLIDAKAEERHGERPTPIEACASVAMHRGAMRTLRGAEEIEHGADGVGSALAPPRTEGAVDLDGFNLHASVAIAADDDLGRERLMRYGARPPLALERLRRLPDGRVAYRIKKFRGGRAKHRVMTPVELLARLAALVPPPRYPLLRYAGVLGPRSAWRCDIVPGPRRAAKCPEATERNGDAPGSSRDAPTHAATAAGASRRRRDATDSKGSRAPPASRADQPIAHVAPRARTGARSDAVVLAPNILSVAHWDRLIGGLLYAATPRVDWASLLRRSFEVDVLACARCSGRLRVLGEVTELAAVRLVLESAGLPTEAPRVARARDPTELLAENAEEW